MQEPNLVLISGVSGAGKSSLLRWLETERGYKGMRAVTTRAPRHDDNGRYEYLSKDEFWFLHHTGSLLWMKNNHGELYGTYVQDLCAALEGGKWVNIITHDCFPIVADVIHAQGLDLSVVRFVHILSPGREMLSKRLLERGDPLDMIHRRIPECESWDQEALSLELPIYFANNQTSLQEFFLHAEECIFAE